jgi:hypothetical protein
MDDYKKDVLLANLTARKKEVVDYAINIENFELAIKQIGNDPTMQEFKQRLEQLLAEHIIEHKKASLMLNVLEMQCAGIQ